MKSNTLFLAEMLMIEQRYRAVKKSPKYDVRKEESTNRKSLRSFLRVSYIANSASFAVFSFLLISPYVLSDTGASRVTNIGFIVYIYALIISIYSSALYFNSIGSMNLLGPVSWLPYEGRKKAVIISWLMYSGSTAIFAVIPAVLWVTWITGNPAVFLFGLAWGFLFIMLGYTIGAFINSFITAKGRNERAGFLSTAKSTLRVLIILLVFAVFEVGIYLPGLIPNFIPEIAFPLNRLLPLVNIPYVVFTGNGSFAGISLNVLSTLLYLAVFLVSMLLTNSRAVDRIMERVGSTEIFRPERNKSYRKMNLTLSLLMKEVRIVARKSQNVILLFIPVIFVFPTILSVLIYGSKGGIGNLGTYFSLISILIICSSFYSLILVVSEGNGIETLHSLPLSTKDIIYSKAIFGLLVFVVIIIPVSLLIVSGNNLFSAYDILVPANLILGYSFSSVFNIRRLVLRIPRGSSTVNFYSFGGGLFIASMFVVTALVVLAPVMTSVLVTVIATGSLNSNPYTFYLIDSIFNFVALLAVVRLTGGKGSTGDKYLKKNRVYDETQANLTK